MLQVKPDMPPPHPLSHPAKIKHEHGPQVWHALILRLLEQQRTQGRIAPDISFSNLSQILFDPVFSHLTTRTIMQGQGGSAATFRPLIAELIVMVVARVARRAD